MGVIIAAFFAGIGATFISLAILGGLLDSDNTLTIAILWVLAILFGFGAMMAWYWLTPPL